MMANACVSKIHWHKHMDLCKARMFFDCTWLEQQSVVSFFYYIALLWLQKEVHFNTEMDMQNVVPFASAKPHVMLFDAS